MGWHGRVIAIGGLGGSGTRVVGAAFQSFGFAPVQPLNVSADSLLFSALFRRPSWQIHFPDPAARQRMAEIFWQALTHGPEAVRAHLSQAEMDETEAIARAVGLQGGAEELLRPSPPDPDAPGIVFKEPNSHVFLPDLDAVLPDLHYVHVMRHGLDMALSTNRKQLKAWGRSVFGLTDSDMPERSQLRYWVAANQRALDYGAAHMEGRFLALRYDDLCRAPEAQFRRLADFAGVSLEAALLRHLTEEVQATSRHRYLEAADTLFTDEDIAAVRRFGFEV